MRPYLRAANVDWNVLRLDNVKEMVFSEAEDEAYLLKPMDILVVEASGSASEVGKSVVYRGYPADVRFQNTLLRVRCHRADPEFIQLQLLAAAMAGDFVRGAKGVGINHLSRSGLAQPQVVVPPLDEQRRIVAILEDHLLHLDTAEKELLVASSRCGVLAKQILLDAIPSADAYPPDWRITTVGRAGKVELGRQRHPDWHVGPNMHPYLRVANVFEARLDLSDVMEMHWPEDTFERFRLHPGDVLLNEGQSPHLLGRPAIYRGNPPDVAFTNSLLRFQVGDDVLPEFALLVFRRHMHAGRFAQESRITTNIAHLSASRLKLVEFPVPPLSVQQRIVHRTEELLGEVDRLQSSAAGAARKCVVLRRSLLAAAFRGDLTVDFRKDQ